MSFGDVIAKVAPWLAAAATGPAGIAGMAVKKLAETLGASEVTAEAITQAVGGATPDQMLALKKADQEFALQMQALGFKQVSDLEEIAAGDRKDARAMQTANKSLMPAVLTCFVLGSFVGTLVALMLLKVPMENRDIVVYMVGQLSGFSAAAVAFWLGTTRQSENKTDLLARAQPIK